MIDAPDARTDIWTDYVWAEDDAEAGRKCQAKALQATVDGGMTDVITSPRGLTSAKKPVAALA